MRTCVRFERSAASSRTTRKSASKAMPPKKASLKLRSPRSTRASASPRMASRLTRSDIKHLRSGLCAPSSARELVVEQEPDGEELDDRVDNHRVLKTPVESPRIFVV